MSKRGFSLIEVILGLALFSILISTAMAIMFSSVRSSRKAAAVALAKTEGAYAMQAMSRMIYFAGKITCGPSTQLTVERMNLEKITYKLDTFNNRLASGSSNLTSSEVKVTQGSCPAIFTCTNKSVNVCFVIDNANGMDVSDKAGVNGIMFQSMITIINTKQ
jgi:prepilin-type N-terminal cleavage/methylation domain-containing protein